MGKTWVVIFEAAGPFGITWTMRDQNHVEVHPTDDFLCYKKSTTTRSKCPVTRLYSVVILLYAGAGYGDR
jgi:hypothetical protein